MKKKKMSILAVAVMLVVLFFACSKKQENPTQPGPVTPPPGECVVVNFPDSNLEAAIRSVIGKPTGYICKSDCESIISFNAESSNITDITGMENFIDLQVLYLSDNQISDISALSGLTNLQELGLDSNQISNISALSGLTNLQVLSLSYNQISDISVLVDNTGIGSGDYIYLNSNPLSAKAIDEDIPALQGRVAFLLYY